MFVSKLFLVFALVLLVGQQLSADPVDYFDYDFPRQPIDADALSNMCQQKYNASYFEALNEKRDHLNYVLGTDDEMFVGMGPLNRPLQHLQIIAIIAHLKAADKLVYFPPDTAQYEALADALIAGKGIKILKLDQPTITARESLFIKWTILRAFRDFSDMLPSNLNYAQGPNLDEILAPEVLESVMLTVFEEFLQRVKSANPQFFYWKTAEEAAESEIIGFKQSQYNALDFVNAKDVEKWVLRGTGLKSIEDIDGYLS